MATVILEDIYKRLSKENVISNQHELFLSKILCKYFSSNHMRLGFFVYMRSGNSWLFDGISCICGFTNEKQHHNSKLFADFFDGS